MLPVLNKIDLPQAEPERVAGEIEDIIGLDVSEITSCSAKTGQGVDELVWVTWSILFQPQKAVMTKTYRRLSLILGSTIILALFLSFE